MSKYSAALRETEDSIKGGLGMHPQNINEILSALLKPIHVVVYIGQILKPRFKTCSGSPWKEMLEGRNRVISTVKRSVYQSKVHDFMEHLSKVPHLVSHNFGVGVVPMQTQNFKFACLLLFLAHLAGILS